VWKQCLLIVLIGGLDSVLRTSASTQNGTKALKSSDVDAKKLHIISNFGDSMCMQNRYGTCKNNNFGKNNYVANAWVRNGAEVCVHAC
jgi:hypothetical protein